VASVNVRSTLRAMGVKESGGAAGFTFDHSWEVLLDEVCVWIGNGKHSYAFVEFFFLQGSSL
jgi:hypothetical protein